MKYEIYKTLVISTDHLDGYWDRELKNCSEDPAYKRKYYDYLFITQSTEYGHRVFANFEGLPDFFKPAAILAQNLGCRWIEYDCDGEVTSELKTYER